MKTLVFFYIATILSSILSVLLLLATIYLDGRVFTFFVVTVVATLVEIAAVQEQKKVIK